ncbi:MAG: hypothetical protein EPN48_03885 [Microbacteriaceae bacterium]|nr:MAG: hypothetical protein EPN48_03885 [Microbacteriaceae bacterium]
MRSEGRRVSAQRDERTRPRVHGPVIDAQTRCIHYGTAEDVVAIKFACCGRYYPCHLCHGESESHPPRQWLLAQRGERAVLCGVCSRELTIAEYLAVERCPGCAARFNDGCRLHRGLYFAEDRASAEEAMTHPEIPT